MKDSEFPELQSYLLSVYYIHFLSISGKATFWVPL